MLTKRRGAMKSYVIVPIVGIHGRVRCAGDKSIAHRAAILSALSNGRTRISNFPRNKDCFSTLAALRCLGIAIGISQTTRSAIEVVVCGKGVDGLSKPAAALEIGESGTTFRLLLGMLAGQQFETTLQSGRSLARRPMRRVCHPLRLMGAHIKARTIKGNSHKNILLWP